MCVYVYVYLSIEMYILYMHIHTVGLTSNSDAISSGSREARCVASSPPTEFPTT